MKDLFETLGAICEPKNLPMIQITIPTATQPAIFWQRTDMHLDTKDGNDYYEAVGEGKDGTVWYGIWVQKDRLFLRIEQIKPA